LAVEREGAASRVDAPQLDDLVISPGGQKGPISAPGSTAYQVGVVVVVVGALLLPLQPKESLLSTLPRQVRGGQRLGHGEGGGGGSDGFHTHTHTHTHTPRIK